MALVLVLVVLPRRYILSSGFRESGVSFPTEAQLPPRPEGVRVAAPVRPPSSSPSAADPEAEPAPGPAEAFWARVLPLLEGERWREALGAFRDYLGRYPDDEDVRRELAVTLLRAGRPAEAVPEIRRLLSGRDDPELRLLMARTLRDLGRMDGASAQYAILAGQGVAAPDLSLEWARSLSWAELYEDAATVLRRALERWPSDPSLRVELARVYYYDGRLPEAEALLSSIPRAQLAAQGGVELRADVEAALAEPEVEVEPPGPVFLAAQAREEGRIREAERLLRTATGANPGNVDAWRALADLLQYERDDLEGTLAALLRVREIQGAEAGPGLDDRIARLEGWTGRTDAARARLEGLLALVRAQGPFPRDGDQGAPVTEAELLVRLGDLDRWSGEREGAARRYARALTLDPGSSAAREGMAALEAEFQADILAFERPRVTGVVESLLDSDDFRRLDLAGEWAGVHRRWSWGVRAGDRWLEGFDAAGSPAQVEGFFAEVTGARWWRWGQLRTEVHLGVQELEQADPLLTAGASLRYRTDGGWTATGEVAREAAYGMTTTLQSVFRDAVQDVLRVTLAGPGPGAWSVWTQVQLSRIGWEAPAGSSIRSEAALALQREVGSGWSLGAELRGLTLSDGAPRAGTLPLFWDPRFAVSLTPVARWERALEPRLTLRGQLSGGPALVGERGTEGTEVLPVAGALLGLDWRGDDFLAGLDLFYRQSRFQGYRNWGANLSVGLPLGGGGTP